MKSLVLLSGGMDSSTALAWAVKESEYAEAVSFNYGQRHSKELESAEAIAEHYLVNHTILDIRGAWQAFAGSALTGGGGEVPEGHYEDETMKQTVVPNRNMILLSLAAGLAISRELDSVLYAAHAGDHAIYPDCRQEFVQAVDDAVKLGNYTAPIIRAPFVMMSKADIVTIAYGLDVPLHKTWSCYKGGDLHCGRCGTCVERIEAFQLANVTDPTKYEVLETITV